MNTSFLFLQKTRIYFHKIVDVVDASDGPRLLSVRSGLVIEELHFAITSPGQGLAKLYPFEGFSSISHGIFSNCNESFWLVRS